MTKDEEIAEKAAREICRILYDHFVKGGWEPKEQLVKVIVARAIAESQAPRHEEEPKPEGLNPPGPRYF